MPLKVRHAWIDQSGHIVPATDNKRYDVPCARCSAEPPDGVGRFGGEFLCDRCLRRRIGADGEDDR